MQTLGNKCPNLERLAINVLRNLSLPSVEWLKAEDGSWKGGSITTEMGTDVTDVLDGSIGREERRDSREAEVTESSSSTTG